MTVPDFDTKKIDAQVMGARLALNYLMENYNRGLYEKIVAKLLGEQMETLRNLYFMIKNVEFQRATKKDDEIRVIMYKQGRDFIKNTFLIME